MKPEPNHLTPELLAVLEPRLVAQERAIIARAMEELRTGSMNATSAMLHWAEVRGVRALRASLTGETRVLRKAVASNAAPTI